MTPSNDGTMKKYGPVVLECVSRSDLDREPYRVRLKEGHYSCNCKGWIFCKPPRTEPNGDRRCKHTDAAKALVAEPVKVRRDQNADLLAELLQCLGMNVRKVSEATHARMISLIERRISSVAATVTTTVEVSVVEEVFSSGPRRIVFDD